MSFAQSGNTALLPLQKNEKAYEVGNGKIFIYKKPRPFNFLTALPSDAKAIVVSTCKKRSIIPLLLIGASTGLLLLADESIANGVQQFSRNIHLHAEEKNKTIWAIKLGNKPTTILKAPQNLNTALYQVGQGFPGLMIGAGLFVYGKINHNYRALSTASQLAESFILMGVTTQILKRVTGRQSPQPGNENSDDWKLLPSFKNFQTHTSYFDAFPSGHLATLMSTVTTLTENYPEIKWIKPVGYSITGLVGLAMINNNAHWSSDYPLAIGLGYLCARQVAKRNIRLAEKTGFKKNSNKMSFTINYFSGHVQPACIYKL
ncbi:MAG: phosphatase PAP2 family protein [Ferruginibacter sp.]